MHTSKKLLQQVRRALVACVVLGGFAGLLQLALPFYALHVLESAVPAGSFETLALLTLIAAGAVVILVCLMAARDRILLRAGLWLDHTLGQHMLENGVRLATPPADLRKSADALALVSGALSGRAVVAALEAPWLPVFLVAVALLHPLMGAVAAVSAALLVLATLAQTSRLGRLARQKAQAGQGAATWWLAATQAPPGAGLPPGAVEQWERLNRAHIAAAYALGRRSAILQDLARLVRAGAQVALIAVGAWLVIGHELTLAGLIACVLLTAALLGPLERLIAALPVVRGAMSAYRQLHTLPADAERDHAAHGPAAAFAGTEARRLNVRGPLALGLAAMLLLIAAGLGAAYARLGDLAGLAGGAIFEAKLTAVHYRSGGAGTRVHVAEGEFVAAGDLIVTLDTAELDRQIVMLKALAQTARSELALIGRETAGLVRPAELLRPDRPKLASLEHRVGELEKEAHELDARIALAEQELAKSQIRAPVSGRVVALSARGTATPSTAGGTIELEIAAADGPLLQRLLEPVLRNMPAMSASVRPVAELGRMP